MGNLGFSERTTWSLGSVTSALLDEHLFSLDHTDFLCEQNGYVLIGTSQAACESKERMDVKHYVQGLLCPLSSKRVPWEWGQVWQAVASTQGHRE